MSRTRTNMEVVVERLIGKPGIVSIRPRSEPVERLICDDEGRPLVKVTVRKISHPPRERLTGPDVSG